MNKKNIELQDCALLCLIVIHFLFFFAHGISHHWGYLSSINDLGHFDQAVWGAVNGYSLLSTDVFNFAVNRLAIHFDPILYIFTPFYTLYPTPLWLTFSQSMAFALTAWPIYQIAIHVTHNKEISLLWAISFLFNPYIISADSWDFHPTSLATLFISTALLGVVKKNLKILFFSTFLLLLCKEHMGISVAGIGFLYGVQNRDWKTGSILIIIGLSCAYIIITKVMPSYSPVKSHLMFSENSILASRYQWLGTSVKDILITCLTKPLFVLKTVFLEMQGGQYLLTLFATVVFLPLGAVYFLAPALSDLAVNLLTELNMPRGITSYHSATIIPVLTVASIFASVNMHRFWPILTPIRLGQYVFAISLSTGIIFLPLPFAINFWAPTKIINLYDDRVNDIKKIVQNSSISVQTNLGAHFSQRAELYSYPNKIETVNYVILWLSQPTSKLKGYYISTLAHHLQMQPLQYLISIENLLKNNNFEIAYWNTPWLVLKRKRPRHTTSLKADMNQINKAIDDYKLVLIK